MFAIIARFELRYQFRNPVFWAAAVLFFLLTFALTTAPAIRLGSGGSIHTNAPTAVAQVQLMMSLFFMFVTTAFVGNVVVRDDETGFGSIIRSTKVGKLPYLMGRFAGAFLGAAVAFLAVPLALWIGTFMPWVDAENLGPNRLQDYAFGYFVLALPNVLITSAIFFAIASWTRSVTYSYLMVIVFMFLYFALTLTVQKLPDLTFAAYLEPFGNLAFGVTTRYLTPIQSNTQGIELTQLLLGNRLLWIGVSMAIVLVVVWRFRFAARGATARSARRQAAREQRLAAVQPMLVDRLPDPVAGRGAWHQLWTRTRLEMKMIFRSPAFWVLAIVGSINLVLTLNLAKLFYGIPIWPRTFAIVDVVTGASATITLLIAIYFSGEVVWRERERRFGEIIDATPPPNWVFLFSKLAGVAGVLLVLSVFVVMLESILFQLTRGVSDIELGSWLAWFVAPSVFYVIQLSILSVVVQAISPNKFVGWGIMVLYLVTTVVFSSLGLNHPLFNYASAPMPLSDMNGASYGSEAGWWLRIYWTAFALVLAIIGHLMWRRGTAVTLKGQWSTLPSRLRGIPLAALIGTVSLTAGLGSFIYYNTAVLNTYPNEDMFNNKLAAYEKKYAKYINLPQPTTRDVELTVDLYPARNEMDVRGTYRYVNETSVPIETLHVRMLPGSGMPLQEVVVSGASLVVEDNENSYKIFRFGEPLQPGATGTVSFATGVTRQGFAALPPDPGLYEIDVQPATNGAYVLNYQIMPLLGMDRSNFIADEDTRENLDLAPAPQKARLEDEAALAENYAGFGRINTDITVTTDADQTPIATGERVSDSIVDGRRKARFVAPVPSFAFVTIQSAQYDVKTMDSGGVELQVYYHPEHSMNIDRMLQAMDDSLDYYRANFGPYQYPYARIIERPGYGGGANSAPGTIGYSEMVGFIMDLSDPKRVDFLSYLTAHELAHQYWFHQLMPADMEGAEVLTESLAQYSALMVMKKQYGPEKVREFLKYELDQYLQGRRMESDGERPLARTYGRGYIHYQKGSIVMYLLQERLGEDRVNAMLRQLLDRYRFKSAPYARSSDLVDGFLSLARNSQERRLVIDQFYRITLYDLKTSDAVVRRLPGGNFETEMTIEASKIYADANGNEKTARFDQPVDVGVFSVRPSDAGFDREDVLAIERTPIRSGKQKVRIVSRSKPVYAGIDPFIRYIDRRTDDNVVAVTDPN